MRRAAVLLAAMATPALAEAPQITVLNTAGQDIAAMTVYYVNDAGKVEDDAVGSSAVRLAPGESTVVILTGLLACRPVYVIAYDHDTGFNAEVTGNACDAAAFELREVPK